jgi:iron complex outermembrane receptor protein
MMISRSRTRSAGQILAAVTLTILLAPLASGQEGLLEEIVVTAEKREASLQDTAIAVSAYQGDFLRDLQIEEIQDIILQTPSMSFSRAGGEGQVFIRGVGSNLLGIGQDSSVAVHQDGVYLGRPHLTLSQFLDVERVEILRGPQGTLYGRNATAGVINVISKKPTEELEGYASGYVGNFDRYEIEAAVGGPVSDQVGFRVAGRWTEDDGFTDDLEPAGGDRSDDDSFWALRGILDFRPSDSFTAEFIAEYSEADGNNRSVRRRDDLHTSQRLGALPNPEFDETRNEMPTFQEWEVLGLTLTLNWELAENLTLTSITGYHDFEDDFSFNTDGTELFVTETQYQREADQLTQELRLAATDWGRWEWLVGFFYMNEDKEEALGLPAVNFGGSFNIFAQNEADAWAVFGQASYNLGERLKLTAGLRYNDEEKDDFSTRGLVFNFDGLRAPNAMAFDFPFGSRETKDDWNDWTPKVGIDFRVNDEMLLYGSVTKGFKSGGTNSLDTSPPFDQEELWSYEAGIKSEWYDNRLRINGSIFFYDYDDLQVSTFADGTTRIENAAAAEIFGAELDLSAILLEGLIFNLGVSWLDTEYDDFVTTFGNLPDGSPNVVDISGNNLINAPEFKIVTNLRYEWELAGNVAYLFGQVSHQDDVFHNQFNEAVVGQDSYTLADARAGYIFGAERNWELAVIVRNAFDEEYFQNSVRFTSLSDTTTDPARIGAALGYPGEGRSYGVQVRYSF